MDDGEPPQTSGAADRPWYLGGDRPPAAESGPVAPPPAPASARAPDVPGDAWPADGSAGSPWPGAASSDPYAAAPWQADPPPAPTWTTAEQPAAPQWTVPVNGAPGPPPGTGRRVSPVVVLGGVLVAVLLLVGAFVVVRQLSSSDQAAGSSGTTTGPLPANPSQGGTGSGATAAAGDGVPLQPVSVTATCQAPPGVDAAGNTITYEPQLTLDAAGATAWRCPGAAIGQQLVYDFGRTVTLTSAGLVPGYAKTDPVDGTDRFAENRTVTAVIWRFDGGRSQRQTIPAPGPTMAEVRLPAGTSTRRVVLEIAGTGNDAAIRDFTAISDVRFTGH